MEQGAPTAIGSADFIDEPTVSYIAVRCPNHPDSSSDRECRAFCGGPSRETIESHDFSVPFKMIMQCGNCRAFYEVTLNHRDGTPRLRVVPKGEHFDIIESSVFFGLESVEGQRAR